MAGAQPSVMAASSNEENNSQNYTKPFITISFLFFMWGFITVMNDVLIPHLKAAFELSYFQAALVQFAFFGAFFIVSLIYFLVSVSKGDPITKIGYKNGIVIGLVICGVGCCLFYPAAQFQAYGFFLSALFVLATGVTILQIAANPYAAILGKPETASSRLNLAQGYNSIGTTLAPFIGALLIYKVFSDGNITVDSLKLPYVIYGSAFIVLALLVRGVNLPSFVNKEKILKGAGALKFRQLRFGMFAIFAYVGAEVAIGSFLINYFGLENIMGFGEAEAGVYLSYYWGGAMIGRFMGSISMGSITDTAKKYGLMAAVAIAAFVLVYLVTSIKNENGIFHMEFLSFSKIGLFLLFALINYAAFFVGKSSPSRILAVFASIIIVMLMLVVFTDGYIAFWSAIAIGLFNSIMWSNIFTLAIKDLGEHTSQGSSLLVMMIVGGALVPPIQGLLADVVGIQLSFLLPVICYLYIVFYAVNGYKPMKN
ncbi:sugar MFS transporter [Reichenbachiella sp. MALMAid0571]|uniref:sugar MFS transporter n=1 Tax=Reichenbachiella sp. MALMAid0571 TaxID=3143939 RepID=UPI0032DEA259